MVWQILTIGFVAGIAGGLFGIGEGAIMVPAYDAVVAWVNNRHGS